MLNGLGEENNIQRILKNFRIRGEVEQMPRALQQRVGVEGRVHTGELVQRLRRLARKRALRRIYAGGPVTICLAEVMRKAVAAWKLLQLSVAGAGLLHDVTSDRDAPSERSVRRRRHDGRTKFCLRLDDEDVDRLLQQRRH